MIITNVSYSNIIKGDHYIDNNCFLIQIVDKGMDFPESPYEFKRIFQFEFSDVEVQSDELWENRITNKQAEEIIEILKLGIEEQRNIVVQCVAGICRSGAVVEVGTIMGYTDFGSFRQPNLYVKRKLMQKLGLTYS